MIDVRDIIEKKVQVLSPDAKIEAKVKQAWDAVAKPLDSLGHFERFIAKIGAVQKKERPALDKCAMLVFCADNGVVEEGISQSDQAVTALCAKSISAGKSCMGIMARRENIDIITVDVGINSDEKIESVLDKKVAHGTKNFMKEPAMTEDEMYQAMQVGFDMVSQCVNEGYDIVGIGEMGIGNTTTSSAVAAFLLDLPGQAVTGRGAGLSDEGLARKIKVVDDAKRKYAFAKTETLKILSGVGGFDMAAMTGACIGAAYYSIPLVMDGFISFVAALCAVRILPVVSEYLIPSHQSREKAAGLICDEIGLTPVIYADMALGEGSGGILMMSLLKTILCVFNESNSFNDIKVEEYQRFDEKNI